MSYKAENESLNAQPAQFVEPKRPMRRLFSYLVSYRRHLNFAVGSAIANKVLDLMPPLLVGWFIDSLMGNAPGWVLNFASLENDWSVPVFFGVLAVLIFAGESIFQWMYQYGFLTLAQKVQHALRLDAYNQIQSREIAFFENHRMGETMAMLSDDVNQLERFLNNGLVEILHLLALFAFAGFVLFDLSWQLALVGLAPVPIIVWGSLRFQKTLQPRYQRVRQAAGELNSRLENNIGGILVVKSFTAESFESRRVEAASDEYRKANYHAIKLSALYVPLIRMAVAIGFGGVLAIGGYWVLSDTGYISVGGLVTFSMMIQRVLWPLTRMGETLNEYARASASARRTFGVLDTPSSIQDPEDPADASKIRGQVEFDRVEFSYGRGVPVLRGLHFTAQAGEMIGIAGTTGAGKSTLIKLLLRLYDTSGGVLRIDGTDIRHFRLKDLRRHIGLVSQDIYLFHGTIKDNIAYGLEDVTLEDVRKAAQLAQLDGFVQSLPEGFETVVGERGIKLSGGQRQRLSIARAILKDAPILILDEATSSVDTETERAIQQNLRRIAQGKTALVIAHRLSTIRHADRIIVLRDGKVEEEGTHDQLVAHGGAYAELWNVQSGEAAGETNEVVS